MNHSIAAEWLRIAEVRADGADPGSLDPAGFDAERRLYVRIAQADGWATADQRYPEAITAMAGADPGTDPLSARWQVLGVDALLQPPEPPEYLVDGMIRLPGLVSIYGVPGELKTMACLDLATSVASGQPWAPPLPDVGSGGDYHVKQGPVLVVDEDNGAARLRERFGALLRGRGVEDAPVHAISLPNPPFNASDIAEAELLAAQIDSLGAVLCVIDNLGTVSGGADENSSAMVEVMRNLRWISEATNCVVVVIHHARKGNGAGGREGDRLRGHSSIEASLDLALLVERSDDDLTIKSTKTRDNVVKPFVLRWTYDLTDFDALYKARFWHVCTTAPKRAEYAVIGDELSELLAEMDAGPTQGALRAYVRTTYNVADLTARRAIEYAETHSVIGYVQHGDYSSAPKRYYPTGAQELAGSEALRF